MNKNESGTGILLLSDELKLVNLLQGIVLKYAIRHSKNISMARNDEIKKTYETAYESLIIIADETKYKSFTDLHESYPRNKVQELHFILIKEDASLASKFETISFENLNSKIDMIIRKKELAFCR
jgi:hypothetical protein